MESSELCLYQKRKNQSLRGICGDLTIASNCQILPLVLSAMNLFYHIMYVLNVGLTTAEQ